MKRIINWGSLAIGLVLCVIGINLMIEARHKPSSIEHIERAVLKKFREYSSSLPQVKVPQDLDPVSIESAVKLSVEQDAMLDILGISESELRSPIKIDKVRPTYIFIANLRRIGVQHSLFPEGDFWISISGIPDSKARPRLGFGRWTTTVQTHQREVPLRGFKIGRLMSAFNSSSATANYRSEEEVLRQMKPLEKVYRWYVFPARGGKAYAQWASFTPAPVFQQHFFGEDGEWVVSLALYENRSDYENCKLLLWDKEGSLIPTDGLRFVP